MATTRSFLPSQPERLGEASNIAACGQGRRRT
jgi:hypothetical protein